MGGCTIQLVPRQKEGFMSELTDALIKARNEIQKRPFESLSRDERAVWESVEEAMAESYRHWISEGNKILPEKK